VLSDAEIEQFVEVGYVRVAEAFPSHVAERCRTLACAQLDVPNAPPWPTSVVRGLVEGEPITVAANAPRLVAAVGQLLHGEAWHRRPNLGLFVVRCPGDVDPGDTGWHIDGSFAGPATGDLYSWYVNYCSQGRGLLLLCLLSDVSVDDAPTRLLEGSHLSVPGLLRPFGEPGVLGREAPLPDACGSIALTTGAAGDVYLCHPFLVHAASWPHRGSQPRVIAQPPISLDGAVRIEGEQHFSPVALAIRRALTTRGRDVAPS
jgi:hypothetical protein